MDITFDADVACPPAELFAWVDDLGRYPEWMDLVHTAAPVRGMEQTWDTELRARVGPLTRSKRLRMSRTVHQFGTASQPWIARFERGEDDGRRHSAWILHATVTGDGRRSRLEMALHYGGGLWTGGLLERALDDHVRRGRQRLITLASTTPPGDHSDVG